MKYKVKPIDGKFGIVRITESGEEMIPDVSYGSEAEAVNHIARLIESDIASSEVHFIEAVDVAPTPIGNDGARWDVMVLKFGKSKTSPHFMYTQARMTENLSAFDGAKLYMNSRADQAGHVKDPNRKSPRDIVGFISNPRIVESVGIAATANILPSAQWLKGNLLELQKLQRMDVLQLSIDAQGIAEAKDFNGERLPEVVKIARADVDIVPRGAAGGAFVKLAESLPFPKEFTRYIQSQFTEGVTNMNLMQKIAALFTLLYPAQFVEANFDWTKVNENDLWTKLMEADKAQGRLSLPDGAKPTDKLVDDKLAIFITQIKEADGGKGKPKPGKEKDDAHLLEALDAMKTKMEALEQSNLRSVLESTVAATKLPEPIQVHIKKSFQKADGTVRHFVESELLDFIKATRDVFSKVIPADQDRGHIFHATEGINATDKALQGLELLFLDQSRKKLTPEERKAYAVPAFRSFKEGYIQLTGDDGVTGMTRNATRLTESIMVADFPKMLGELINKVMVREYNLMDLNGWRSISQVVPVSDFRTQHRVRWGGYANLPTVNQRAPYLPLTSPTDEEATYTATKRGGTEDMTREAIMNDDIGWLSRIPMRLARAAYQTLHEFAFDFVRPGVNPTIYDTLALYHATHANTATTALAADGVAFSAARLRMKKQANKDNAKRLGLRARFLLIPPDLEQIGYGLVTPAFAKNNAVPEFYQQLGVMPIVVDYWTDVTDWVLACDPADLSGLEIGFVGGQQDPMTFVSDLPNAGSLFTNDVITFKIRHEYGGAIIDFRAFDGSIVAG